MSDIQLPITDGAGSYWEHMMIAASGVVGKIGAAMSISVAAAEKMGVMDVFLANPQALSSCGILVGMGIGVTGLSCNILFQWRRDRRETEEHLNALGRPCDNEHDDE